MRYVNNKTLSLLLAMEFAAAVIFVPNTLHEWSKSLGLSGPDTERFLMRNGVIAPTNQFFIYEQMLKSQEVPAVIEPLPDHLTYDARA